MVNKVTTATVIGLNAYRVDVETDVINSLPGVSIVGLPDAAINEARARVRSAIKNSNLTFPDKKVVINLAPADLKKEGTIFDLPIAVGILIEECTIDKEKIKDYGFAGVRMFAESFSILGAVLFCVLLYISFKKKKDPLFYLGFSAAAGLIAGFLHLT